MPGPVGVGPMQPPPQPWPCRPVSVPTALGSCAAAERDWLGQNNLLTGASAGRLMDRVTKGRKAAGCCCPELDGWTDGREAWADGQSLCTWVLESVYPTSDQTPLRTAVRFHTGSLVLPRASFLPS